MFGETQQLNLPWIDPSIHYFVLYSLVGLIPLLRVSPAQKGQLLCKDSHEVLNKEDCCKININEEAWAGVRSMQLHFVHSVQKPPLKC